MTRQEADILLNLYKKPYINQRLLSETTGYSIGVVNKSLKQLVTKGYINEHMMLTKQAFDMIHAKSPRNAIILAAGLGMRMVPINHSVPKALLEVKGEKIVERLIKQLNEVGINDITVVVGFMKDSFEYLIDEYSINLVYASDYAITNNMHSLFTVSDLIGNTYIMPCDLWFKNNPFREEELYSWYMISDCCEETSEIRLNRKKELVRKSKKENGNRMVGVSYLTTEDALSVATNIKNYSRNRQYDDSFWEEALYSDDRMFVQARVVHDSEVVEINTYEQLRDLDSGSNQLQSEAIHIITKSLHCQEDDIKNIEILKKGMTNRSFLFQISKGENAGRYIMRIPGEGTERLIDRKEEALVYRAIEGCDFCDAPIYLNPDNGFKITRYIENVRCCNPENEEDLQLCMKKLKTFHNYKKDGMPLTVTHTFDLFEKINFYEGLWQGQPSVYKDYYTTKRNCQLLAPFINTHRELFQLTHIDAVPDNFLFDPQVSGALSIQLTDWEYAAMQDKHVDIAMFCIYSMYNKAQIDHLIDIYFEDEGGCDKTTRTKIYCYIAVCGLIWSNWCEYKRGLGVEFGEYSLYQYRYSKEFFRYAVQMMEEIGEPLNRDNESR